jgi:hypothetical protein
MPWSRSRNACYTMAMQLTAPESLLRYMYPRERNQTQGAICASRGGNSLQYCLPGCDVSWSCTSLRTFLHYVQPIFRIKDKPRKQTSTRAARSLLRCSFIHGPRGWEHYVPRDAKLQLPDFMASTMIINFR